MQEIKFQVEAVALAVGDTAYVSSTEDPAAVIADGVIRSLSTDISVTVGGVTATLAMWQDPGHWEAEWAGVLGGESFEEYAGRLGAE
jgi:hypothetical protein